MRVLYLKLKNFIGIRAGLDKNEIEINFNIAKPNNIIMLFGSNGSGKTTILSTLNPFSGTNDDRATFIIPDTEGYKEIHYKYEDKYFVIQHHYGKKMKSFIRKLNETEYELYMKANTIKEKNQYGTELNPNGGVNSFKNEVMKHLNVDESYFKIGRIGSNVTNFIDMSAANRKKYISMFLPNIDSFLKAYSVVGDKYRLVNKEIKVIADQITHLGNKETIQANIDRLTFWINDEESKLKSLEASLNEAKGRRKTLIETYDIDDSDRPNKTYQNKYSKAYVGAKSELESIRETLSYLKEVDVDNKSQYESKLAELNNKLASVEASINAKNEYLTSIKKELISLKDSYSAIKDNESEINRLETKIKLEEEYITNMENDNESLDLSIFTDNDKKLKKDTISKYNTLFESISDLAHKVKAALNEANKNIIDIYNNSDKIYSPVNGVYDPIATINAILSEYQSLSKTAHKNYLDASMMESNYNDKIKYVELLDKRPSTCKNDECEFIASALQYKNARELAAAATKNKNKYEKSMIEYDEIVESIKDVINIIIKPITQIYSKFMMSKCEFENDVFKFDNYSKFESYIINTDSTEISNLALSVGKLYSYKCNEERVQSSRSILNSMKDNLKTLKDSSSLNNSIIENIKDKENKVSELESEINSLQTKANKIKSNIEIISYRLVDISNYLKAKERIDEAEKNFKDVEKKYNDEISVLNQIHELDKDIESKGCNITTISGIIKEYNKELEDVKYQMNKLDDYEDRLAKLNTTFNNITLVRDALSPTKGIPLYFINNYLNNTRNITNELLDISQQGKFAIDFNVDESNFFIKVYKDNGDILDDISDASQGESALTSLSLSLALIEQSMTKYNILYLDELDGALDEKNRRHFITMVENQMKKLNIEQIFIISHNKEFDYYPLDLILLKNHSFNTEDSTLMSNKNVIFEY